MHERLARRLVSLYPPSWRAWYGAEFAAFLEERPTTPSAIANVIGSATLEQLRAAGDFHMDARQRTLVLMDAAISLDASSGI